MSVVTLLPYFDCDNMNESLLDAYRKMIVVDQYGNVGLRIFTNSTGGGSIIEITDGAIITEITDESNWSLGVYVGSTTGLIEFNVYLDTTTYYMYYYDGTNLIRWQTNNMP